jgi:hypothetical protein
MIGIAAPIMDAAPIFNQGDLLTSSRKRNVIQMAAKEITIARKTDNETSGPRYEHIAGMRIAAIPM